MPNKYIVFEDAHGTHELAVGSLLAADGKLYLSGAVDSESAEDIIKNMIYLSQNNIPITLFIDSPGGEVRSGLAIIDMMEIISKTTQIDVICTGKAYSMAAVILAAGSKGHRHMLPHAQVLIHEPLITSGGGSASSVKSTAESLLAIRDIMSELLAKYTGNTVEKMNEIMHGDTYLNAKEAIELGVADDVTVTL